MEGSKRIKNSIDVQSLVEHNNNFEIQNAKVCAKGNCGVLRSIANCVALLIGLGVLSLPYAIAKGGWVSLGINGIVAMAYFYTTLLLLRCLEVDPELVDYQDISRKAFGRKGYVLQMILMCGDLLSALLGYGISMSDNLVKSMQYVKIGGVHMNRMTLTWIATTILLPSVWIRNLKSLAWVSIVSIMSSFIVIFALAWTASLDGIRGWHNVPIVSLKNVSISSGLILFTYGANVILPSIRTSMIDRTKFPKVLVISFLIATTFYGGVGTLGASIYGLEIESQVTLNMELQRIPSKLAVWANVLISMMKFSILSRPIVIEIERLLPWDSTSKVYLITSLMVRTFFVLGVILISLSIPYFGYVVSLMGSSITMSFCLIYPCCLYWKLFSSSITSLQLTLLLLLIIFGVFIGIIGTIHSIVGIV